MQPSAFLALVIIALTALFGQAQAFDAYVLSTSDPFCAPAQKPIFSSSASIFENIFHALHGVVHAHGNIILIFLCIGTSPVTRLRISSVFGNRRRVGEARAVIFLV
jgi:hypothetical protein